MMGWRAQETWSRIWRNARRCWSDCCNSILFSLNKFCYFVVAAHRENRHCYHLDDWAVSSSYNTPSIINHYLNDLSLNHEDQWRFQSNLAIEIDNPVRFIENLLHFASCRALHKVIRSPTSSVTLLDESSRCTLESDEQRYCLLRRRKGHCPWSENENHWASRKFLEKILMNAICRSNGKSVQAKNLKTLLKTIRTSLCYNLCHSMRISKAQNRKEDSPMNCLLKFSEVIVFNFFDLCFYARIIFVLCMNK